MKSTNCQKNIPVRKLPVNLALLPAPNATVGFPLSISLGSQIGLLHCLSLSGFSDNSNNGGRTDHRGRRAGDFGVNEQRTTSPQGPLVQPTTLLHLRHPQAKCAQKAQPRRGTLPQKHGKLLRLTFPRPFVSLLRRVGEPEYLPRRPPTGIRTPRVRW